MNTVNKVGFRAGIIAFAATITYCIVQVLQLYDIIVFPMDERLIYGSSLCIVIPFVFEILALHYITPEPKQIWTHAALIFTIMYAVFVSANYVVQLATVIPYALEDSLDEVRILQQTPRSLFWNFDAIGYICMGLATLAAVPALEPTGFQKWVRIAFIANAFTTVLISIVYFYPTYSTKMLLLALPWVFTVPGSMLLLALMFRKPLPAK